MSDTWIGGERLDFSATDWTLVRLAARDGVRMDALIRVYWKPLYFFVRRKGFDNESAKDLVQGFLTQLLRRELIAHAEPRKGRFRTLLLAALENYLKDRARDAGRAKRDARVASIDFLQGEAEFLSGRFTPPDAHADQAWAHALFAECLSRLEASPAHELALKLHLAGESHASIAERTGLGDGALRSALHRLKERFREILTRELSSTAPRPDDVPEEIEEFISLLR